MKITENALAQLKTLVTPDSGLSKGIRIFQGNGCCGSSYGISVVKQPSSSDIKHFYEGINFYIDPSLSDFENEIVIDFNNQYFQLFGIPNQPGTGCC